jgi:hypothetical protein
MEPWVGVPGPLRVPCLAIPDKWEYVYVFSAALLSSVSSIIGNHTLGYAWFLAELAPV